MTSTFSGTYTSQLANTRFAGSQPVATYHFPPIRVLIGGVFPVPIVDSKYEFIAGLEAALSGKFEATASSTYTIEEGALYQNGTWSHLENVTWSATAQSPTFEGKISAATFLEQKLTMAPYGVTTGEINLSAKLYLLKGETTVSSTAIGWNLSRGVTMSVNAKASVLGKSLVDYSQEILKYEQPISTGSTAHDMFIGTASGTALESVGSCVYRRNYTANLTFYVPHTSKPSPDTLFSKIVISRPVAVIVSGNGCVPAGAYSITWNGPMSVVNNRFSDTGTGSGGVGMEVSGTIGAGSVTGTLVNIDPFADAKRISMPYTLIK